MKNNIKNTLVKVWEDRLYFQYFMLMFCLCPKSVIITTLILMIISVKLKNLRGMSEKFKPHHASNALEVDLSDYFK